MSDNFIEFDPSDYPTFNPGVYGFEVKSAEKKLSKAGKPMIELTLNCWQDRDPSFSMRDWLVTSYPPKIKAFCAATGLSKKFHEGKLSDIDCIGKTGYLRLDVEDNNGKKRNFIAEYKLSDKAEITGNDLTNKASKKEPDDRNPPPFDDDIPF